ncbi:MAG: PulJ/GspJ family protein [Candidatus Saccharimonadales bacterium]
MRRISQSQKGFTIAELLIATAIFTSMMLLATSGVLYIGRVYYKGVIVSKTQDTSRTIIEDISRNIQTGGNKRVNSGAGVVCVGLVRYSYVLNMQLTPKGPLAGNQSRHVLWVDRVKDNIGCPAVANMNTPETDVNREVGPGAVIGRELVGANMRLVTFNVDASNPSAKPAELKVKVVYGDFDLSPGDVCISSRFGGQFCATAEISTFVKNRL